MPVPSHLIISSFIFFVSYRQSTASTPSTVISQTLRLLLHHHRIMDNPDHGHGHAHSKTVRHDDGNRLHQCLPLRRYVSNRKSTHPSCSSSPRQVLPSVSKGSMRAGGGGLKSANLGLSHSTCAKWFRYGQPKIDYIVRSGSAKTSPRSRCGLRRGTTCFFLSSTVDHSDRNSGKRRTVKRCKFLGNVRSSQDGAEYKCKFLGRVEEGSPLIATSKSSLQGGIGPGLFDGLAMVDETHPNLESSSHSDIEDKLSSSGSNLTWELQSASSQSQSHSHSRNKKLGKESPMNEEVCSSSRLGKHVSTILRMWKEKKEMVVMKDSCNMQPFRLVPYALEEAKLESISLPPKVLVPLWMQNLNSDSTK